MFNLNYEIIDVKQDEKEKLYKLLQYALYDGSQYIDNDINEESDEIYADNIFLSSSPLPCITIYISKISINNLHYHK